jgi:possible diamine N-acetyltransferase
MKNKYNTYLRPFREDDYVLINKWRSNYNTQRFTGGPIRFVSLEIEREWVKSKIMNNIKEIYLAICQKEDELMVGYISLNNIDHLNKSAELGGYVIGEKTANRFTVFEAVKQLMDYAFYQLNIHRVDSYCLTEHPFTPFCLRSFGYIIEGIKRDVVYKNGEYKDMFCLSVLHNEYDKLNIEGKLDIEDVYRRCLDYILESKTQK